LPNVLAVTKKSARVIAYSFTQIQYCNFMPQFSLHLADV